MVNTRIEVQEIKPQNGILRHVGVLSRGIINSLVSRWKILYLNFGANTRSSYKN